MPKLNKPKNYKELSAELSELTAWFESGEGQVDEALAKYEHALRVIAEMEKYLKTAENKLRKINAKL